MQVCSFRSSFYLDVLRHFASFHTDSRFLLCVFCLKVTRNPVSYQQHLLRHQVTRVTRSGPGPGPLLTVPRSPMGPSPFQVNQAFHCNRCRLQFVFQKDKIQHKLENHRSFRRPAQLEGLPPGSKVSSGGRVCPSTASSVLIHTLASTGDHQDLQEGEDGGAVTAPEPLPSRSANQHQDGAADVPDPDRPR